MSLDNERYSCYTSYTMYADTNLKTVVVRNIDVHLWRDLKSAAIQKGSPSYACLNWAIRDWIQKVAGSVIRIPRKE